MKTVEIFTYINLWIKHLLLLLGKIFRLRYASTGTYGLKDQIEQGKHRKYHKDFWTLSYKFYNYEFIFKIQHYIKTTSSIKNLNFNPVWISKWKPKTSSFQTQYEVLLSYNCLTYFRASFTCLSVSCMTYIVRL